MAVLGAALAEELFSDSNPIGQSVTVGTTKLTIIGVADEKGVVGFTDFDSQLYVPITIRGKAIGVLSVDNQPPDRPFTEEDEYALSLLADCATIAVENARLAGALK